MRAPSSASPTIATKNTTRVAGADPIADAAGVALAVYPSAAGGTHPYAVAIAPTDDWQAAIAASVLMAPPIRAPLLLSGPASLPSATAGTLRKLAPTGSGAVGGAQLIRVGDVPSPTGYKSTSISPEGSVRAGGGNRPVRERRGDRQAQRQRHDRLGR